MTYEEIMSIGAGDVVQGGYSMDVNATYIGPGEKLLNKDGSIAPGGHAISKWDPIVVLDISYSTQLALIQYPAGGQIRQGYIHNSLSHIEYKNLEQNFWQNGSTPETVYYSYTGDASYKTPIPAHDKAIFLYKVEGRYNVAYWTNKGAYTCAGFVNYSGGITPAVTNGRRVAGANASVNDIPAGGIVPGGRTYPANAISHQNQEITDVKGNGTGHSVNDGDELTVIDISYSRQRALVQYPAGSDIRQGYIVNDPRFIVYKNPYTWVNGSTEEVVYSDIECTKEFGTINPYEAATVLYKKDGKTMVVYDAPKADTNEMEMLNKNGFVRFPGNAPQATPSAGELLNKNFGSNVQKIPYGTSPLGHPLNVYKIGSGSNVLFANFAIHGFEDDWDHDGTALVTIGNQLIEKFAATGDLHGWTVYVNPCANPDGTFNGITNDGPGRCTVESRIDMNRCFPAGFEARLNSRNYVGYTPLGATEAVALKDIVEKIHSEHINGSNKMVLVDFHGWMGMTQGNQEIGKYFNAQFNGSVYSQMVGGFFSTWAQDSLSNTRAVLVEYPKNTRSIAECINDNYSGRTYDAFMNLLSSEPGNSGSSGTSSSCNGHVNSGVKYVNVRTEPNTASVSTILGQLYGNNPIQILAKVKPYGDSYYWYKIVFIKDGERLQAYVREDFVTVTGEIPKDDTPAAGGEPGSLVPYDSVGQVNNNASSVHVRKGAGTGDGCGIITSVNSGELLMIIGKTQPGGQTIPWYEINLNGQELYIRSDFVDILNEVTLNESGTITSTIGYARMRILPGTSDECHEITKLNSGTRVSVISKVQFSGDLLPWYRVKINGKIGFIRSDLITLEYSNEFEEFKSILKELYFTINLPMEDSNLKILNFLRMRCPQYIGEEFNIFAGNYSDFNEHIKNSYSELYHKFDRFINNNQIATQLGNTSVGIPHLAIGSASYIHFPKIIDFWTGWGGDLATFSAEAIRNKWSIKEINLRMATGNLSSFTELNFYEDIDAIWFSKNIFSKPIYELFDEYFNLSDLEIKKIRLNLILNDIGCDNLDNLNKIITNKFEGKEGMNFPLINSEIYKKYGPGKAREIFRFCFRGLKEVVTTGGEYNVNYQIVTSCCEAYGNKIKAYLN